MLHFLFQKLAGEYSFFNVGKYISFRAGVALLTAMFISFLMGPWFIRQLKSLQIGQQVRDDGPKSHLSKSGTPTMGGTLILFATLFPAFLWSDLSNRYVWYAAFITVGYGILGFMDDYLKISKKNTKGVSSRKKLFFQFAIAGALCSYEYFCGTGSNQLLFPFFKNLILPLGFGYVFFSVIVIVGASNAVNLTDGLDGLAIGPIMINAACFAVLAYVTGNAVIAEYLHYPFIIGTGELVIFAASMVGAGLGFLWFNTYPAQVFMGDVGSLPLGGALGLMAVLTKHEILLIIIGGIFVVEALSVIAQVSSFKMTGKRVLKMAPIHHHFELKGWPEPKVIVRFWILSIILAMIGLLSLKLR